MRNSSSALFIVIRVAAQVKTSNRFPCSFMEVCVGGWECWGVSLFHIQGEGSSVSRDLAGGVA